MTITNDNERQESLMDSLHNCLMCDAPAYETEENEYACSKCEWTWKVVNCG